MPTDEEIYAKRLEELVLFTDTLKKQIPFQLVKYNDGEWYAMDGVVGCNCDNHQYSPELQKALQQAYKYSNANNIFISDFIINYNPLAKHTDLIRKIGYPNRPFTFFALLHDLPFKEKYTSLSPQLYAFYETLRQDKRKKILVGPTRLDAKEFLHTTDKVNVPLINAFNSLESIKTKLTPLLQPNAIVLLCCGFTSCLLTEYIHKYDPSITIIDLGSALDPVLIGKTRKSQIDKATLQDFYQEFITPKKMEHIYSELQGWFNFEDYYKEIVDHFPNGHFVELGVWKGKSSSFLATEIYNSGKNIILDCVDHFKGSAAELTTHHIEATTRNIKGICANNLRPFWATAKNNSYETRIDNIIKLVVLDSQTAANTYEDASLDFVFIDAGHTLKEVLNDISWWLPKIKPGGILAGHDYKHATVKTAVNQKLKNVQPKSKNCWQYIVPSPNK